MKRSYLIVIGLCSWLLSYGCLAFGDESACSKTKNLSFEADVKPLLESACKSCHTGYHDGDNFYTAEGAEDNYEVAERDGDPGIEPQVVSGSMPLGRTLTECQIDIIKNWKAEGFTP